MFKFISPGFAIKVCLIVVLILFGKAVSLYYVDLLNLKITPANEPVIHYVIVTSMITYTVLMAIPFVPSAEIGLAAMMVLGGGIAPLVYGCTLVALCCSYAIGRFIPERYLVRFFSAFRLNRLAELFQTISGLHPDQKLEFIIGNSPKRLIPLLVRYRYLGLIMAIAVPGNIVIGGGGGIAMIAGMTRLFSPFWFFLSVAVAVAPVPLAWVISSQGLTTEVLDVCRFCLQIALTSCFNKSPSPG